MEKHTRKRERFESNPSNCVEREANPRKRLCEDSNCGNVDIFSEIMSKMDTHEVDWPQERIQEELVWDMMKKLQEEIVSSPSHEEPSVNNFGSNQIYDIVGEYGDYAESVSREDSTKVECEYSICNGDLGYLFRASDSELGIPCSPQMDFFQSANEYYHDYGFFECLEMERDAEYQLSLQNWWGYNESEESETKDLISIQDCNLFSNELA